MLNVKKREAISVQVYGEGYNYSRTVAKLVKFFFRSQQEHILSSLAIDEFLEVCFKEESHLHSRTGKSS